MKNSLNFFIVGSILFVLVIGCNNKSATAKADNGGADAKPAATAEPAAKMKPIVDIPQLANKSPEEVEKLIGKAVEVDQIKSHSEYYPGEFRNYEIAGLKDSVQVRFYKGKAIAFVLTLPSDKQTKTAEDLAKLGGFDVSSGRQAGVYAVAFDGTFNGVVFQEVKALKSKVDDFYNLTAKVQ